MSKKNSKNGIGTEMNSSKEVTPETPRKEKTPRGYFHYNKSDYPMISENLPKEKIWCKYCKVHNAKVIGIINPEGTYRFVIKCPFHGRYTMEIRSFMEHFPDVNLPDALNKLLFPEGYPIQHSYCRNCRATTGKVVSESADGRKWQIECQTPGCDQKWMEDKESFRQKYIGDTNHPPMYRQTSPQTMKDHYNMSESNTESQNPFAQVLKDLVPKKENKEIQPKETIPKEGFKDNESLKIPEAPQEIRIEIPAGKTPIVKYLNGALSITFC